jgi:hypothetical protein
MVQYCSGIASEFEARLNRVRTFIPDHNLTSGTANEIILRGFLARFSAGQYRVGQGFICDPTASDLVSKQCDILVYDCHNYPLVHSEGEVVLIFPQAAKMVIEVKTRLNKKDLKDALENIRVAKQLNSTINGVVFAFKSCRQKTVIKHLQQYAEQLPMQHAPIAILLFDRGVIINRWPGTESGGGENLYQVRASKDGSNAIVIAFLHLLFFDVQMQEVWGGAGIANMMRRMLEDGTDKIAENVQIGSAS